MLLLNSAEKIFVEDLNKIEKKINLKFPEDYRSFIIDQNGGIPEKDKLYDFYDEVTKSENTSVIRSFFSIFIEDNNNLRYNLLKIYNTMQKEKTIEKDMLPFADDPLGNPICISLKNNDYGTVYYLNHEFEDEDTGYLMKSKISDSFTRLLNILYDDE